MNPEEKLARLKELSGQTPVPLGTPENNQIKNKQKKSGAILGSLFLILAFFGKFKFILFFVLTKLKFLFVALQVTKISSFFLTFGSMFASILIYSRFYGLSFAAGFVILIFIHELGHGVAAKLLGLKVSSPIFIPFVGALIMLRDQPQTRFHQSLIGAGGPFFGACGALIITFLAIGNIFPTQTALFYAVAHFTFVINLFNLLPVFGLDGDRITRPLSRKAFILLTLSVCAVIYEFVTMKEHVDPNLMIIGLLLFAKCFKKQINRESQSKLERLQHLSADTSRIEEVSTKEERLSFLMYLTLLLVLSFSAYYTKMHLTYGY
jgi:Zn-dependent protease